MPILGLGLHILVALYFAVHAIRSGRELYWLLVLFSFPLLGSVVYFFAIWLPNSRLERNARHALVSAGRSLDPTRALREARDAFDYTPTAQNRMRLAAAQLDAGAAVDAAANFEACLEGPFAGDLEIRFGAARANLAGGNAAAALAHLEQIRRLDGGFRAEEVALLTAQTCAALGRHAEAKAEFEAATSRFGSFAVRAEFAIWAAGQGDPVLGQLRPELESAMARWTRHTRQVNQPLVRRLKPALAAGATL
jgi:hypothetical protein